ncbi:MAG TPA: branched-chain amino acid ABC transporter permease [Verrucomicrobiae bacterium]|nr:branched-chain amino acid ABC transporter permease [Verrucomicrobiae bacterium]
MSAIVFYIATVVNYFFIYNILAWGLNIQFGYAGILDFTYITFMAVGAYVAGVTSLGRQQPGTGVTYILGWHLPFPLPLLLGGLAAALLGLLVGLLAINRLRSDYLAIVTLSVGIIIYSLVGNLTGLFDGFDGLVGVPEPLNGQVHLGVNTYTIFYMAVTGVVMVILWFFAQRLRSSALGRTMRAIREDVDVAESFGKNTFRIRLVAMVIGCFYAGIGGALLIGFVGAFSPGGWSTLETFIIWAVMLIGGRGNNWGSVLGSFLVIALLSEATRFLPAIPNNAFLEPALRNIVIGAGLIVVLRFRPQGILPERKAQFSEVRAARAGPGEPHAG